MSAGGWMGLVFALLHKEVSVKYKARWRRLGTYQETFEAVIEADDLDELSEKFDAEEYLSFLKVEEHLRDTDHLDGPSYEEVKHFEQIN